MTVRSEAKSNYSMIAPRVVDLPPPPTPSPWWKRHPGPGQAQSRNHETKRQLTKLRREISSKKKALKLEENNYCFVLGELFFPRRTQNDDEISRHTSRQTSRQRSGGWGRRSWGSPQVPVAASMPGMDILGT